MFKTLICMQRYTSDGGVFNYLWHAYMWNIIVYMSFSNHLLRVCLTHISYRTHFIDIYSYHQAAYQTLTEVWPDSFSCHLNIMITRNLNSVSKWYAAEWISQFWEFLYNYCTVHIVNTLVPRDKLIWQISSQFRCFVSHRMTYRYMPACS